MTQMNFLTLSPATLADADRAARAGADRARRHADRVVDNWSEAAAVWLLNYARRQSEPFLIEDAREWAEARGLPKPPDGRAYGGIMRGLVARGEVVAAGWAPAKSSNTSLKRTWQVGR